MNSEDEDYDPQGCVEMGIKGIVRIIGGALVIDAGPSGFIPLFKPDSVAIINLEQACGVPLDGQRVLLRVAFLDMKMG